MSRELFEDRVRGVLFGQAIGDALGLGTEFLSKRQVAAYYPHGLHALEQIVPDRHRARWAPGDWTDDTDQMLCILESLLETGRVDIRDIAARVRAWAVGGGMGIGMTVADVVYAPDYLSDPHGAAERIWKMSGGHSAANGAVMRTSVLGIWEYGSPEAVVRNAAAVCKITHFDPRCVASCVCVCHAISALLNGARDIPALAQALEAEAIAIDERTAEYFARAQQPEISGLGLDESEAMGYTLKTMGAGIWALLHPADFRAGLSAVIHEGGDADTNGAVAGSILGARFGWSGIPREWIDGLLYREVLEKPAQRFLRLLV